MQMVIDIRNYCPADRESVYDISVKSKLEGYHISELDTLYSDWKEGQLVALVNGRLVGFLSGKKHDARTARIYMLAVLPEYRSMGIGQSLLDRFFLLSENEFDRVILEVRESNTRAQKLYERNGFEKIDEIEGLYENGELAYRLERIQR